MLSDFNYILLLRGLAAADEGQTDAEPPEGFFPNLGEGTFRLARSEWTEENRDVSEGYRWSPKPGDGRVPGSSARGTEPASFGPLLWRTPSRISTPA